MSDKLSVIATICVIVYTIAMAVCLYYLFRWATLEGRAETAHALLDGDR